MQRLYEWPTYFISTAETCLNDVQTFFKVTTPDELSDLIKRFQSEEDGFPFLSK